WIRRDLGYDGVIISDSLRMAAVAARWSAPESAVLALAAGADVANAKCEAGALPVLIDAMRNALDAAILNPNELRRSADRLLRTGRELESP
ncbi:glycoside hydrolase family 3 N-terminal domain-containing protein, partial [Burkholderia sp. SIMBA_024]|uniref:glycoside hydrolase family 3 N-terminal domain-containing protein n=1 Tax=Burkholderia sp. SIMBA_024 TaxID=3085768 RepID=UPI003979D109